MSSDMTLEDLIKSFVNGTADIRKAINEKGVYVSQALSFLLYGDKVRQIVGSGESGEGESNANSGLSADDYIEIVYIPYFSIDVSEYSDLSQLEGITPIDFTDIGFVDDSSVVATDAVDFSDNVFLNVSDTIDVSFEYNPELVSVFERAVLRGASAFNISDESEVIIAPKVDFELSELADLGGFAGVMSSDFVDVEFDPVFSILPINIETAELWGYDPRWVEFYDDGAGRKRVFISVSGESYDESGDTDGTICVIDPFAPIPDVGFEYGGIVGHYLAFGEEM